jgi:hypothetical protein
MLRTLHEYPLITGIFCQFDVTFDGKRLSLCLVNERIGCAIQHCITPTTTTELHCYSTAIPRTATPQKNTIADSTETRRTKEITNRFSNQMLVLPIMPPHIQSGEGGTEERKWWMKVVNDDRVQM